ncbi:hypothetical protein Ciccas_006866 [Cichlidogyrus casuarinus]|uniref:Immunoglobulin-like beta-sandwich domain-containing protein n=1 Tax=Cichlidogyrus casuarinus TaxID=1844966 RepID=A0ABD2Q5T0_9PLAT
MREEEETLADLFLVSTYVQMSWWKENADREISFGQQVFDQRFKLDIRGSTHWSLHLTNAQLSDSGRYICQINSVQLKEKFIELRVKPCQYLEIVIH